MCFHSHHSIVENTAAVSLECNLTLRVLALFSNKARSFGQSEWDRAGRFWFGGEAGCYQSVFEVRGGMGLFQPWHKNWMWNHDLKPKLLVYIVSMHSAGWTVQKCLLLSLLPCHFLDFSKGQTFQTIKYKMICSWTICSEQIYLNFFQTAELKTRLAGCLKPHNTFWDTTLWYACLSRNRKGWV